MNSRLPTNRVLAEQWNSFLGIDTSKILHGFICIEHFENECLDRNGTRLKANAVPTISNVATAAAVADTNENDCTDCTDCTDIASPPYPSSSTTAMVEKSSEIDGSDSDNIGQICEKCEQNYAMIKEKEAEIERLKIRLGMMLEKHRAEMNETKTKLRKTQKQVWHLATTKRKLEAAFEELRKESLVNEEVCKTLEVLKTDELFRVLHHGVEHGQKYPEKVRHFCLGLITFSPRAYEFVRKTFHNHLPHPKTIQNWFANSDICGDPGIQEKTLGRLRKIADEFKEKHGRELMCSLIFDEIHLRQQIIWSLQRLDYIGYVDFGHEPGDDQNHQNTIAKQAIVFLLNGIEVNFEFPVAYYLIDELDMNARKDLLNEIIPAVTRCGIKITNLTFDGHSANVPACELLIANLKINLKIKNRKFMPYVINPISKERIHIIMDPCHMEKLVRNRWADCGVFFDGAGNKIEWRFIEALYTYSCANDFRTHKLTKKHMQWQRNPMSVRLAVETFSESVASSIEYLMDQNVPEFQGARATIGFIRRMNTLFDIFNSRHCNDRNIFKRRLSPENKRIIFDFFRETTEFFKTLKVEITFYKKVEKKDGKEEKNNRKKERVIDRIEVLPILHTRHRVSFRGFIINMESLMAMFEEYVEKNKIINSIPTYNLLQDAIEMMFGRIRACGGFNNNPNVQQFKGAFRKIQSNMRMDLSTTSNCRMFDMHLPDNLFFSDIYFTSSRRARITMNEQAYEKQKDSILELIDGPEEESIEECDNVENMHANHHMLDGTSNFMNTYIASQIEQKIMKCKSFHCNGCRMIFDENEKMQSVDSHLMAWKPCTSTVQICKTAEKFFKLYDIQESRPTHDFKVLYCLIFRSMNFETLYSKSKFECDLAHKYQFIKCIVGQYIGTRANQIARQITFARQKNLVRQQCNHLVNFRGQ